MSEELIRALAKVEQRASNLEQSIGEHRHYRDPQWDIWSRKINNYGRTSWDDHFRSGVIPTGYAWLGAPFGGTPGGAGGILDYSYRGTYLRVECDAAPHFLSIAVGSYSNKWYVARCLTHYGATVGIRVDDGTVNNSVEFSLISANIMSVRPTWTTVTGGAAPVVTATSTVVRSDIPHTMLLWYNPTLGGFAGYIGSEMGLWDANAGYQLAIGWVPARIGLLFDQTVGQFSSGVDLIYNEYV